MTSPRIIFTVSANETLEQAEELAMQKDLPLYECIEHTDYIHAFTLMQIGSVNENLAEEGIGEWTIRDASDWACNKFDELINAECHWQNRLHLPAIYDEERRYPSLFVFSLLNRLLTNTDRFRVDQTVFINNDESFIKWSNENLIDEYGNPVSAS